MVEDKLAHFVNRPNTIQITFARCPAPGEQAMTAEDEAFNTGILRYRPLQHQREFEAGPLPGEPPNFPAELPVEFVELLFAIGTGSERYGPIRMQVIHVIKRQERMQSRVN